MRQLTALPEAEATETTEIKTPSGFYRAGLWKFGLALVRIIPQWLLKTICVLVAEIYFRLRKERREIVVRNVLPGCNGDKAQAERTAHRLFRNFGAKLAELWRLESGVLVKNWLTNPAEWELVHSVLASKSGVLFVTTHLGNWEHGGLLLAQSGTKLSIVTQPEPGELTEIRTASRARWGIDTIVIGADSFAFVEVIKKLQDGAAVAISIDRPPQRHGAEVELFGKPFVANNAAADLAWASGCAVLGVVIIASPRGHAVKVFPEFKYQRENLRNREGRRQFTQQILRAFEPEILQHLDQWYHFVPVWPKTNKS